MQTKINIQRLKPIGNHVLVKRGPVETRTGVLQKIEIPEEYRDRNDLKGHLYTGIVIAVGKKTKASKFGRDKGWYEPGDMVWFHNLWDWKDHEVVIKDEKTGDDYLVIDESDVKAYEILEVA